MESFSKSKKLRFVALGESSMMFLIQEGEKVEVRVGEICEKEQVGIFCFGKGKVKTQGFKWDLSKNGP